MKKLNLHTHTIMSDGYNTMWQMVKSAAELGHCAIGITDHANPITPTFSANKIVYESLLEHIKFPIPVFIGAEIVVPKIGECLLFGDKANRMYEEQLYPVYYEWIKSGYEEDKAKIVLETIAKDVLIDEYALIWCHPGGCDRALQIDWVKEFAKFYIHGYENWNAGHDYTQYDDLLNINLALKPFQNCDAHDIDGLKCICNELSDDIKIETMNDLLKWIG